MEVKNKEGFRALSEVVEAAIEGELMNQKGMTFDEAKAEFEKMVQYQMEKNGLSRSEAVTEVVANTVPVILTDEQQGKRFADKVMKSSGKVRAWFEQLIKDLRAILDKAYNIIKGQKSWEQMELIRNNKQTLDMIADYYFEGMEGTKATNSDSAQSIIFSAKDADITAKQKAKYDEYVQNALAGAGNNINSVFDLAYVSEQLINDLKEQGVDVSGCRHRMRDNDIRHIRNSHGISKDGTYGITTGDLQAIPYIVNNYTEVKARLRNGRLYGVVYALDHVDTTYFVEGYANGKYLDGKQMIKAPSVMCRRNTKPNSEKKEAPPNISIRHQLMFPRSTSKTSKGEVLL